MLRSSLLFTFFTLLATQLVAARIFSNDPLEATFFGAATGQIRFHGDPTTATLRQAASGRLASHQDPPDAAVIAEDVYDPMIYRTIQTAVWTAEVEHLLWWTRDAEAPPLVTRGGTTGALNDPGTQVIFGGPISQDEAHGGRLRVGYWTDDVRTLGIEFELFAIAEQQLDFTATSTGVPILARPFTTPGGMSAAVAVAAPNIQRTIGGFTVTKTAGTISASARTDFQGASAAWRRRWIASPGWRFDLLGGYRYLRLRDDLLIRENSVGTITPPLLMAAFDVRDEFSTENNFHGGGIGASATWSRERWDVNATARVALGVNRQTVQIDGSTSITAITTTSGPAGINALQSNIGTHRRTRFSVAPEVELAVRYQARENLTAVFGYSLLLLTNTVRAGSEIDGTIDPAGFFPALGPVTQPAVRFHDETFWAQGIHTGIIWKR